MTDSCGADVTGALIAVGLFDEDDEEKKEKDYAKSRYWIEKYVNGIESGNYSVDKILLVSEREIKEVYGNESYMLERYKKLINLYNQKKDTKQLL